MLIKRPSDIKPSEITPESAFFRRRDILKAALAAGLLPAANAWGQAIGGGFPDLMPLADGAPRQRAFPEDGNLGDLQPVAERRGGRNHILRGHYRVQQLLRVRYRQDGSGEECAFAPASPMDRDR